MLSIEKKFNCSVLSSLIVRISFKIPLKNIYLHIKKREKEKRREGKEKREGKRRKRRERRGKKGKEEKGKKGRKRREGKRREEIFSPSLSNDLAIAGSFCPKKIFVIGQAPISPVTKQSGNRKSNKYTFSFHCNQLKNEKQKTKKNSFTMKTRQMNNNQR